MSPYVEPNVGNEFSKNINKIKKISGCSSKDTIVCFTVSLLYALQMPNKPIEFEYKIYAIDNYRYIYLFEFYSRVEGLPVTLGLPVRLLAEL